jgi:hypothetical protein
MPRYVCGAAVVNIAEAPASINGLRPAYPFLSAINRGCPTRRAFRRVG